EREAFETKAKSYAIISRARAARDNTVGSKAIAVVAAIVSAITDRMAFAPRADTVIAVVALAANVHTELTRALSVLAIGPTIPRFTGGIWVPQVVEVLSTVRAIPRAGPIAEEAASLVATAGAKGRRRTGTKGDR
ncbi:uncharacterized protein KD926_003247, partial [Aspergillus affinis]|uniref:uncharacterized protein n=1 Tax=Aspergillus affinis TaxID=1070780 RepID=UPI0022FEEA53